MSEAQKPQQGTGVGKVGHNRATWVVLVVLALSIALVVFNAVSGVRETNLVLSAVIATLVPVLFLIGLVAYILAIRSAYRSRK